jgi:photosynthetic reaction center cytochrome c subunit
LTCFSKSRAAPHSARPSATQRRFTLRPCQRQGRREARPELRLEYPEKINDRDAYLLLALREGQPQVKLYFDEQSGLLIRMIRYAETPLGRNPNQIDYVDYRKVDCVEVPFRITTSQPENTSTFQFEEVRQNLPIDLAKFTKSQPVSPSH